MWLGVSTWVLRIPSGLFLAHNRAEDLSLLPAGEAAEAVADPAAAAAEQGLTLRQALATPTFWILCSGLFGLSMLVTSLHFFQVSILTTQGLGEAAAARIFPISALVMVIAIPLVGKALDRFPTHYVFAFGLVVMVLSLSSASQVHDLTTAMIYAVAFGLNNGCTMTFFGYVWPRFFGRKHLGAIQGTGQMIGVMGAAAGPTTPAMACVLWGSYDGTLLLWALSPAVGAVGAFLFLRTPPQLLAQQQGAGPK